MAFFSSALCFSFFWCAAYYTLYIYIYIYILGAACRWYVWPNFRFCLCCFFSFFVVCLCAYIYYRLLKRKWNFEAKRGKKRMKKSRTLNLARKYCAIYFRFTLNEFQYKLMCLCVWNWFWFLFISTGNQIIGRAEASRMAIFQLDGRVF